MSRPISSIIVPFVVLAIILSLTSPRNLLAKKREVIWTDQEKPIVEQLKGLRQLPDDVRARTTKDLALQIARLPATPNKLRLANGLANLSTEGDFGLDTLQAVATTLAEALRESPVPDQTGRSNPEVKIPAAAYLELARLVRYEHVEAPSMADVPQFREAMSTLEADDEVRQKADFTLTDLTGKSWTLKDLRGKVVLVNFWATWCPPCRKEIPDLISLYQRFQNQGLVILGISDEPAQKVGTFAAEKMVNYPVLLDPDEKVHKLFMVEGIPKTFIYDREGKLVTQSIDMRARDQFLKMLAQAGIQ